MRRLLLALAALGLAGSAAALAAAVGLLRRFFRRPPPAPPRRPERTPPGRLLLLAAPPLGLAGFVLFVTLGAPWLLARQHYPSAPKQPIHFDHAVHVEQVGLDCAFCHLPAYQGASAGLPDVQQCMFCHTVVEAGLAAPQHSGQIQQLRAAWTDQQAIDWVRIHHVPDHTRFPHAAHVAAGVACETCHGEVGRMSQVSQVRSLKMGDCVACHQDNRATVQCGACHH